MNRSKWKRPYIAPLLIHIPKNKTITATRNSEILPNFITKTFNIHNGKTFIPITIQPEMVGHKFGEFIFTRKQFVFKKKLKHGAKN